MRPLYYYDNNGRCKRIETVKNYTLEIQCKVFKFWLFALKKERTKGEMAIYNFLESIVGRIVLKTIKTYFNEVWAKKST